MAKHLACQRKIARRAIIRCQTFSELWASKASIQHRLSKNIKAVKIHSCERATQQTTRNCQSKATPPHSHRVTKPQVWKAVFQPFLKLKLKMKRVHSYKDSLLRNPLQRSTSKNPKSKDSRPIHSLWLRVCLPQRLSWISKTATSVAKGLLLWDRSE